MQRKVVCLGEMSSNPFSTLERQNFPEFSPVFTKTRTPSSTERNGSFHWSIDHIARLKPADIDTDPATLVKTNGHSPENDNETQKAVDTFFSQRTILPSPWTTGTKTAVKRVTFSPLPPAMAFIQEDPPSLVESDLKDAKTAECGTQTVLTFPFAYDLEKLLAGTAFCFTEDDNVRDISNSSLRRKLFGQPDRQGSSTDGDAAMDVGILSPRLSPVSDPTATQKTPLSKKGHCPSSSSTPLLHPSNYHSPAIIHSRPTTTEHWQPGDREGDNPAMSSMVLPTLCNDLPEFSPIREGERESSLNVEERDKRRVCSKSLFPVTPCKIAERKGREEENAMSVSPILSPIRGPGSSPYLTKPGPMVIEGVRPMSTGKTTSTPNTAVMKRQLAVSPFASPVLKQPCTQRADMEDCNSNSDPCETEDLAQPLSLSDLKTETYDFTNITAMTCTSYFTQVGLEDGESRHPLHSTATHSKWQPPVHSTMVDPQRQLGAASLPTVQGVSQIPSSTWAADSGVAASAEFNATSAQSLTGSSNELGITRSSSNPFMLQANKEELHAQPRPNKNSQTATSQTQIGTQDYKSREKRTNSWMLSTAHPKSKHPSLPTIREGQTQTDMPARNEGTENNVPCESDSGLVTSPDETYSRQITDLHRPGTCVPTSSYVPVGGSLTSGSSHPTGLKLQGPMFPHTTKFCYDSTTCGCSTPTSPLLQYTPSRYTTAFPFKSGLVPHQTKFPTVFQNGILPSRPKLSTTPIPSLPSALPQPENSFGVRGGGSLSSVYHTPPSRYSGLRGRGGSLGDKTSFAGFTREVLRKKASLKSRLQFSSPIRSTSPFNSPVSSPLHMPISGATQAYLPVARPRTPLTEVVLNGPKSFTNCCTPFSHSSGHKTAMAFKIS